MLVFPTDFFKDEIRNDFLISEMMKRAWAAHLKILDELQALFKKYDLLYYADFGTLLGAVRHGGIIPWDDDIDISMPRADFMKLLEHADEIGGGLTIRSVYNTDSFTNFHAVATHKTDLLRWDDDRMRDYYGCPFICYIDIFPMDYIPRDPEKKKLMQQLYSYAYQMVYTCVEIENSFCGGNLITYRELKSGLGAYCQGMPSAAMTAKTNGFLSQLKELEGFLSRFYGNKISIDKDKKLRSQLCLVTEYIASSCNARDADRVDYCPHMAYLEKDLSRDKNWVKETVEMPFEVTTIAAPKMYHEVLVSRFSTNYMTPRHLPSTHEYPYYRTQVEVLIEGDTGENYHEYPQKKELLDVLETFKEGHQVLDDLMGQIAQEGSQKAHGDQGNANVGTITGLLADLQDGAVGLGEAIDNICGEGTDPVNELEKYCESVYHIYEKVENAGNTAANGAVADLSCDSKISVTGGLSASLQNVRRGIIRQIHEDILADWEKKLRRPDGSTKKVVIYGVSAVEALISSKKSAEKIRNSLEIFDGSKDDVCVIFEVPQGFMEFLNKCSLELTPLYADALSFARQLEGCIFDDGKKLELAVSLADAYYGDKCPLMDICKDAGMPVMIQNYDIR